MRGYVWFLFSMIDAEDEFGEYRRSIGHATKKLWESREFVRAEPSVTDRAMQP